MVLKASQELHLGEEDGISEAVPALHVKKDVYLFLIRCKLFHLLTEQSNDSTDGSVNIESNIEILDYEEKYAQPDLIFIENVIDQKALI